MQFTMMYTLEMGLKNVSNYQEMKWFKLSLPSNVVYPKIKMKSTTDY